MTFLRFEILEMRLPPLGFLSILSFVPFLGLDFVDLLDFDFVL